MMMVHWFHMAELLIMNILEKTKALNLYGQLQIMLVIRIQQVKQL